MFLVNIQDAVLLNTDQLLQENDHIPDYKSYSLNCNLKNHNEYTINL